MMAPIIKPNPSNGPTRTAVIKSSGEVHRAIVLDKIRPYIDRDVNDEFAIRTKETQEMTIEESPQRASDLETSSVSCVAFSSCGKAVVCGCNNGAVCIWRKCGHPIILHGHPSSVSSIAFSPLMDALVAGYETGHISMWSLDQLVPTDAGTVIKGHDDAPVHSLCFVPNTNVLISGGCEASACIWDLSAKRLVGSMPDPNKLMEPVAISQRGDLLECTI